ncbi:MAG: hypothetical protein H3C43_11920 [Leptonema sp. (in: Bacteria)]|nr:hypothetical protein [Leptonema sp. (in: bacteria)]
MLQRKLCITVVLVLLFFSCSKPNIRELNHCRVINNLPTLVDFSIPDANSDIMFLALQDRHQVDADDEWLNTGRIGLMKRQGYELFDLQIEGRDEYPFRPLGIDSAQVKNDVFVFVVNQAFINQRSVEIYQFKNGRYPNNFKNASLLFLRRLRTRNLANIVDVAAYSSEEFMLLREKSPWYWRNNGSLIFYSDKLLRYWPNRLGNAKSIVKSDSRTLYVPNGSELFQIDVDTKKVTEVQIDSDLQVNSVAVDRDSLWLGSKFDTEWVITNAKNRYRSPVQKIDLLLTLKAEQKLLIGQLEVGISECDLPN